RAAARQSSPKAPAPPQVVAQAASKAVHYTQHGSSSAGSRDVFTAGTSVMTPRGSATTTPSGARRCPSAQGAERLTASRHMAGVRPVATRASMPTRLGRQANCASPPMSARGGRAPSGGVSPAGSGSSPRRPGRPEAPPAASSGLAAPSSNRVPLLGPADLDLIALKGISPESSKRIEDLLSQLNEEISRLRSSSSGSEAE
ncbi:unnamed protein product, partial [Polarella glacialis]